MNQYILIYWLIYALNGSTTTSTATFDSEQACERAAQMLSAAVKNGNITRYVCVPKG